MLIGNNISFSYNDISKKTVLDNISFEINEGDFIALIGASGSGKTTFVKHLNGLLKATSGSLTFEGEDVYAKKYPISKLRKSVGMVFQYPEHQLFGKTVIKDAMYGPLNLGMTEEAAREAAVAALKLVGIEEEYYNHSPLELSGGQKRCVAIAGILAMEPKVLVLDEPAAGLDPETKREVFDLITRIRDERNIAIVLVSHHMEDVVKYANRVWVLHEGQINLQGTPKEVFSRVEELRAINIGLPDITEITDKLIKDGFTIEGNATTVEEAERFILKMLGEGGARDA